MDGLNSWSRDRFNMARSVSGSDVLAKLMRKDAEAPANCWTFDHKRLGEGIILDLKHPAVRTAAFINKGGRWVMADNRPNQTPLYKEDTFGLHGRMRRAHLHEVVARGSGKSLSVLSRLEAQVSYALVHVDADMPNVKAKLELVAGIRGMEINSLFEGREGLYMLSQGSSILVFRKDGSVVEISYNEGKKPVDAVCGNAAAVKHRLDYIQYLFGKAAGLSDREAMVRRQDWLCHQLVGMLELLQHVRNVDERNELQSSVVDRLNDLRDKKLLRTNVLIRLQRVLAECDNSVRHSFDTGSSEGTGAKEPLTFEQQEERRRRLAKRTENLQKRAAENQAHVKGPSPAADSYKNKKK